MNEENIIQHLMMDGYGIYVWSAYGITILICLALICRTALREYRIVKREKMLKNSHLSENKNANEPYEQKGEEI